MAGRKQQEKRKFVTGILWIVLCPGILLLTGCGTSGKTEADQKKADSGEEVQTEKNDKVQIGLTVDSFVIERWIRDRDAFVATARELGAEVNVQDAGADSKEQISQIEYFISKQMDVIVVIARDCGALSEVIQKAHNAGIKVISYDRLIHNADADLYISFDNGKVGEIMAQSLIDAIPQGGDIFMIQGSAADNNVTMVRKGFDKVLKNSNLKVVYEANCDAIGQRSLLWAMWRRHWKSILMFRELCVEMMILPVRWYRCWQRISWPEKWLWQDRTVTWLPVSGL